MKKTLITLSTTLAFVLSGCSENSVSYIDSNTPGTATISIYKDNSSTSTSRYLSPKDVTISHTYNSLNGILANNENVCPSIGDVNILVIPVHLPGSTYNTQEVKEDIENTFFGSKDEDNLGYPSLSEYYYESSYQKLNFSGFVTDWFDVTTHTNIQTLSDITQGVDGTIVQEILNKAVEWAFSSYDINKKDFDKNSDGSIDAVWMIYDHHNYFTELYLKTYNNEEINSEDINEAFWNYTSWDTSTTPDINNPTTSAFSWASFDQMYLGYNDYLDDSELVPDMSSLSEIPLDSHTFIHETGHLLGLEDYYGTSSYRPLGSFSMMDQNVGDFDSYSKMILGWVTPYVVYGTSEILIESYNKNDHSVIVIPSNYSEISSEIENAISGGYIDTFTYEFNPFSEYIMIDLYSPSGLNYDDVYGDILTSRERGVAGSGVRIYHVDSRIFKCNVINYDGGQALSYVDGYSWDGNINTIEDNQAILMAISNNRTESTLFQLPTSFDYFDQIRLIEANGTNTFDSGSYVTLNSLWNTDSDPFDIYTYAYQFFNANYNYNDGNALEFKIKVDTLVGDII